MQTSKKRITITQLANALGVTTKTIIRWEKSGRLQKPKRDWKGWRFYHQEDFKSIRRITQKIYR